MRKKLSPRPGNWHNTESTAHNRKRAQTVGKTKGANVAEFDVGTQVRIADRAFLEARQHQTACEDEQVEYADRVVTVQWDSCVHGGHEIYQRKDIPGVWHEECMHAA